MSWSEVFQFAQFSPHSEAQIERRGISKEQVVEILSAPEQVLADGEDKVVAQSRIQIDD